VAASGGQPIVAARGATVAIMRGDSAPGETGIAGSARRVPRRGAGVYVIHFPDPGHPPACRPV